MPITINGNGAISGLGDIDGHDLETATLVVSGDTTIAPQAVGRASLFVDDSANTVGINTTTPSSLLEVQGKGDKQVLRLTNPSNTDTAIAFNDSSNTTGNAVQFGTKSGQFQFVTGSLERLRITDDGKIGINTATPTETVEVRGPVDDSNLFLTTNSTAADSGAIIGFQSTTNGWTFPNSHAQIKGGRVDGSNGYLEFYTRQSATNTLVMRLHQNGNVGINTTNPTSKLHIEDSSSADTTILKLRNYYNDGINNSAASLRFETATADNQGGTAIIQGICGTDAGGANNQNDGGLRFLVSSGGGATLNEAARFTTQGNLAFPSTQGIDFSASEGSGASSSILDDYEEGTFTPTIRENGTGTEWDTITSQNGWYTRVGRLVTFGISINYSAVSSAPNPTFYAWIAGLPFSSSSTQRTGTFNVAFLYQGTRTDSYQGSMINGNPYFGIYKNMNSSSPGTMRTQDFPSGQNVIECQGFYFVNS